eukprot:TRINITY_DN26829_c0_g1_i1.p1 TRINITY_DN26829_c0_g1~~TRINITY_DN26829_c0_g1_i1.p1  ORF type:complete len:775 (+),score=157.46 TRINITY_DN26829_c0_g1_i1:180-2504(+)
MFDWNDGELVDIIWGEVNESDDHIVPYPKDGGENTVVPFRDYGKKQRNQEASLVGKAAEPKASSGVKNDIPVLRPESKFCFDSNEDLSAPRLGTDSLPDLGTSYAARGKGYAESNSVDYVGTKLSNDFTKVTNMESVKDEMLTEFCHSDEVLGDEDSTSLKKLCRISAADTAQLQSDAELFGNVDAYKEGDSFLEYSWGNIGNFDDLDRIFRNDDSILGHELIGNADELWSSSADVISSTTHSFPMAVSYQSLELSASRNTSGQHGVKIDFSPPKNQSLVPDCGNEPNRSVLQNVPSKDSGTETIHCSYVNQEDEFVVGEVRQSLEEKTGDDSEATGVPTASQSWLASKNSGIRNHFVDKVNKQRKLLKSRKKAEEKSKSKLSLDSRGAWPPSTNQVQQFVNLKMHASPTSSLQTFPSSVFCPKRQLGGPDSSRYLQTSNPYMHSGYVYATHNFPVMPLLPHIRSERDQSEPPLPSYEFSPGSMQYENPSKKLPDAPSRPLTMTPQEKIEKLRRRQQMQAMLAIQQQQQKFDQHITCTDPSITQKYPQDNQDQGEISVDIEVEEHTKNPPLEPNLLVEEDGSNKISMSTDECSLAETIFNQLQDSMEKLDMKTRLCIRDSLFRLARSAMQRQCICDTSSTNKSSRDEYEETSSYNRSTRLPDAETDTNPIDRTMAHFLFHRPSGPPARTVKEGILGSPISNNPKNLSAQPKTEDCVNLPLGCLAESSSERQSGSYYESQTAPTGTSVDPQHRNHSESMSTDEGEDVGAMEVQAY